MKNKSEKQSKSVSPLPGERSTPGDDYMENGGGEIEKPYSPFKDFIKKFSKQKMALIAFFAIAIIIILAILAPMIVPYNPTVDVLSQYSQEEQDLLGDNRRSIGYEWVLSDGSVVEPTRVPMVESGNRRVVNARGSGSSITATAVNEGETFVAVSHENVTNYLRIVVTQSQFYRPILTALEVRLGRESFNPGEEITLEIKGRLSDGEVLEDPKEIARVIEEMEELQGTQDTTGGRIAGQQVEQGEDEILGMTFRNLDEEILTIEEDGRIIAESLGLGTVQVSLGGLSTVVQIPVGSEALRNIEPVVTAFQFEETEAQLVDLYKHQPPSSLHFFGTDHQNRDIFSRVLVGTRQTLAIGFVSVILGALLGTTLGLIAGYYGGRIDSLLTRASDVLLAFPGVLLAIAVIAILGPGIINIIFAVAVFTVPIFLRIVRSSAMSVKNMTYVEAARSIGVKNHVIIFRHILPGTMSVIIVYLTMRIGTAIIIGAVLSYLGLGGDITAPEWGAMLNAAKDNSRNVFHPTLFPGLAIVVTVLAFNLLGDGLRDALDPKLKE